MPLLRRPEAWTSRRANDFTGSLLERHALEDWTLAGNGDSPISGLERRWTLGGVAGGVVHPWGATGASDATPDSNGGRSGSSVETDGIDALTGAGASAGPSSYPNDLGQHRSHGAEGSVPSGDVRVCQGCGLPLEGKRQQAKHHGSACRQRAYRIRKKRQQPAA
jgi:hypothetical protein